MKLNQREQRIIQALQNGEFGYYSPYNPHEFYLVSNIGKCTREIKKLIKLGLVEEFKKSFLSIEIILTEEGKNFECEFDKPYDIWVVTTDWGIEVNKYSGFLNKNTLLFTNGASVKKGNDKKFFTNRDEAFAYAIKMQESCIRAAEGKVHLSKERLNDIKKQLENPELDKAGYL